MHPIEPYLEKLAEIRASGHATDETSYYPAIEALLAEVGKQLKPRVVPVQQLRDTGADHPDGGLFTQDQLRKNAKPDDFTIQPPNRGVIEVKGLGENLDDTIKSEQVAKYVRAYGQVLLTNYREFRVVIGSDNGNPRALETLTLAKSEAAFWSLAAHPRKAADASGKTLEEFLKRALMSAVPIQAPDVLAGFLASYAREALAKIEPRSTLKELADVHAALEEALGLKFDSDKGEHFFRSTLVQTLFYGLFSAWVLWSRAPGRRKGDRFDWRLAVWSLQVPMIRALYERLVIPAHVRSLGLEELLNLTGEVLNRVDNAAFFARFEESTAVQYFYEPFLEAFDPELRKQLGVWYTPREIVRYMVERVDRVLRSELGIASGLADPNVYVLDPACGTGAYVVEVLDRIHKTLVEERGEDDKLTPHHLKKAAKERIFGFEILPAPFVISHMQIGMFLQRADAPLETGKQNQHERAGVFLTNALTGWEPPDKQKARLPFEEFQQEREQAETVKRETPILVVIGNPPYNAFAGVSPTEEDGLVEPYKNGLIKTWGIKKFNLDDLYVRFFRLAERRIAEKSHRGVVCYISNYSYLSEPSYVVMRERFLQGFDSIWIDCMNGDSRSTGKLTPEGKPDPSVFSTEVNPAGIRVGTAIALMARSNPPKGSPSVAFRQFWGSQKRTELLESLVAPTINPYELASPNAENRYSFLPQSVSSIYRSWPKVSELSAIPPFNGPIERRSNGLIAFEQDSAKFESLQAYLNPDQTNEEISLIAPSLMQSSGEFHAQKTRKKLAGNVTFRSEKVSFYPWKPFDNRWAYLDSEIQPLFSRPNPPLLRQASVSGQSFLITRDAADKAVEGVPFFYSRRVVDYDFLSGHARLFPVSLRVTDAVPIDEAQMVLSGLEPKPKPELHDIPNISEAARSWLSVILGSHVTEESVRGMWLHVLAIGFSAAYLEENADGIRKDWPRIPLPASLEQFNNSAVLGGQVADLLDTEQAMPGVTTGVLRAELRGVAAFRQSDGEPLKPEERFAVTAGWGHLNKADVIMPGQGKLVRRKRTQKELAELVQGISGLGLSEEAAISCLGSTVVDVYLNDRCAWTGIPEKVWELNIGGYQVIKKWLSYREHGVLGRALTLAEADEVQAMARRLTALCLLQPRLDANYEAVKAETWQREVASAADAVQAGT